MTELDKILLTTILTIIGGICVYIFGRIIEKFIIDPLVEYKKTIGLVIHNLVFYANIYSNPTASTKEQKEETSTALRKLAAELYSKTYALPLQNLISKVSVIPSRNNSMNAAAYLIGLSNSLYTTNVMDDVLKRKEQIEKYLNIKT